MSLDKIRNAGIVGLAGALLFLILLFGLEMFLHHLGVGPIVDADMFLLLLTLSFAISFALYLWAVRGKEVEFGVVLWRSKHIVRFFWDRSNCVGILAARGDSVGCLRPQCSQIAHELAWWGCYRVHRVQPRFSSTPMGRTRPFLDQMHSKPNFGTVFSVVVLFTIGCNDYLADLPRRNQPEPSAHALDYQIVAGAQEGSTENIRSALEEYEKQQIDILMRESFSLAVVESITGNHIDAVEALLEKSGVDFRLLPLPVDGTRARDPDRDQRGLTPLMVAAAHGNSIMVLFLIQSGATVQLKTESGTTAIGLAEERGHTDIVKILIDASTAAQTRNR